MVYVQVNNFTVISLIIWYYLNQRYDLGVKCQCHLYLKNSEYGQEIPQSQTADNLWHNTEESHYNHETSSSFSITEIKRSTNNFYQ